MSLSVACAKGGLVDPSPVGGNNDVPAGGVLSVVSGETGAAVTSASVTLDGRPLTLDGAGQVTLPAGTSSNGVLEIRAPGYLDRLTRLRSREPLALWPRQSATGLDESFTQAIVYSDSASDSLSGGALHRPGTGVRTLYVAPSRELQGDGEAMTALQEGAARLSAATGGLLRWAVLAAPPAGALRFDARFDPADAACTARVLAYASRSLRGSEIVGGSLVFCRREGMRLHTVMHELGHTLGLRHSPDRRELMFASSNSAEQPSAREALVMRLMLQRLPGNRPPDDDRETARASALTRETVVCY